MTVVTQDWLQCQGKFIVKSQTDRFSSTGESFVCGAKRPGLHGEE